MARAYFSDVVIDVAGTGEAIPLDDIEVTVTKRDSSEAQIFENEVGGAAKDNPFITGPTGDISFYAEPGSYTVSIADTEPSPRIVARDIDWDSVPYNYVFDRIPPGSLIATACRFPPEGWLRADGSTVSRATYAALWDALRMDASGSLTSSSPHGDGNGTTTFNLPNKDDDDPLDEWIVRT